MKKKKEIMKMQSVERTSGYCRTCRHHEWHLYGFFGGMECRQCTFCRVCWFRCGEHNDEFSSVVPTQSGNCTCYHNNEISDLDTYILVGYPEPEMELKGADIVELLRAYYDKLMIN